MNKWILSLLCALSSSLSGSIFEIQTAKEISQHVKDDMLIIFDIDNTLLEPAQDIGSDQWFYYRIQHHQRCGASKHDAFQQAVDEWVAVQLVTSVLPVEDTWPSIIQDLQDRNYTVIGLTIRPNYMEHRTALQLLSIGIDLSRSAPKTQDPYISYPDGSWPLITYQNGILYSAGHAKGPSLDKWLTKLRHKPKAILLIDDKGSHLASVEKFCNEEGIEFTGLRYGYLDEKVASFDGKIADHQWNHFVNIPVTGLHTQK